MTVFRDNEKEFAIKLKSLKIEQEEERVEKTRFSAKNLLSNEKKRAKSSIGVYQEKK